MKKFLKGLIITILAVILINPTIVAAIDTDEGYTPSKISKYSNLDYVIDKYDININVNENNTFDITETITAYFNVAKHGIYRTIPSKNTVTRLDGTTSKNRAQLTNLSVDNKYTLSKENGNYKIRIGSSNNPVIGEQTYMIKYTYNLGKDPSKNYDELYYNLIGSEWDTVIGNITFTITMPKEFDASKLGFSSGTVGSTDSSNITYNVDGNIITGRYNGILNNGEALTVRCELSEGYFVGAGLEFNVIDYFPFLLPIIFLLIAIAIWYIFGRDNQVIETVEFYPPEGFNSLEVGYLYNGRADNKDVTSLLIYLANKGYIKITETKEKSLFSASNGFKITKLKEYDGDNINERLFLNGLFSQGDNNLKEVSSTDLFDKFFLTMNKILLNINNKENKEKIFEKKASNKSKIIIFLMIAAYCLITIPPIINYSDPGLIVFALVFPGVGFTITYIMLKFGNAKPIGPTNGIVTGTLIGFKLFGISWGLFFGGIPWAVIVLPTLTQDPLYLIGYIVGIICIIGMFFCLKYLPKRTKYGNEILGKLKGFKNFLETAEKDKLESMVMQDPTYFYNILPYTYVLGVSDTWIKKFETITLQSPKWYDSPDSFDVATFGTFMATTMASAETIMSSSPTSSSSSSSDSGGGSSDGGSGGGGGGSW